MMTDHAGQPETTLGELINLMLEGQLSTMQREALHARLMRDDEARRYYSEFLDITVWMRQHATAIDDYLNEDVDGFREKVEQDLFDSAIRRAMAETREVDGIHPAQRLMAPREYHGPSFRQIVIRSAAILVMCASVIMLDRLIMRSAQIEPVVSVANLTKEMNTQWGQSGIMPQTGEKLYPGRYVLEKGYATIGFHDGADVVVQAPAEFRVLGRDNLFLQHGRVCTFVHERGIGFTVHTPSSSVIDLGTEFGVNVWPDGSSEVHMLLGKASVVSGPRGSAQANQILTGGQAGQVDKATGEFRSIPCRTEDFVRRLTLDGKSLWRGEPVQLADIIGGGNGLGTGRANRVLDINGSSIVPVDEIPQRQRYDDYEYYRAVKCHPMIDYFFSCNLRSGNSIRVSSKGDVFKNIPHSRGDAIFGISNGRLLKMAPIYRGEDLSVGVPRALHFLPSLGVTFDLKAIGDNLGSVAFEQFRATGLINEAVKHSTDACADFWVLVDGQPRFQKMKVTPESGEFEIKVPIEAGDRFLSLALTDGGNINSNDYCLFVDPQLIAKNRK